MYESKFREDQNIIREAKSTCMIFSASYNSRYYYPYKLRKVGAGWEALDKSCFELMLDSNINDSSVTNEEIIDEAVESNATYVIPKDYIDQPDRTRESLVEFEHVIDSQNIDLRAKLVPILQDPHVSHLREHEDFYNKYTHIAVGGMKGNRFKTKEKIKRMRKVRKILGDKVHIHGFGMGCSLDMIKALRSNPNLLDSIDMATAERMVINGKVADWTLSQKKPNPPIPYGEDKSTINAGFSKAILMQLNYMLTDRINTEKLDDMFIDKLGLDKVQEVVREASGTTDEQSEMNEIKKIANANNDTDLDKKQQRINSFS